MYAWANRTFTKELADHMGELYALDRLRKFEFGEFFALKGNVEEKEAEQKLSKSDSDKAAKEKADSEEEASKRLMEEGFDPIQHEQFRTDLREGKIGLASNRLPLSTSIEDVVDDEVMIYFEAQNAKAGVTEEEMK